MHSAAVDFATTHWSMVVASAQRDSPQAVAALEELCRAYWYPIYAFVRHRGHGPQEAEDLVQAFFARFLERHLLDHVDRSKGRFRSFLLTVLKHFLADEWDRSMACKRGGRVHFLSVEAGESRYWEEAASGSSPEQLYEQRWACVLLERVMKQLEHALADAGKDQFFRALKPFLVGESRSVAYARLATELGVTEGALKMKVRRMRRHYQQLLRQEIAQTVASPEEVDDEIRYLFRVLSE